MQSTIIDDVENKNKKIYVMMMCKNLTIYELRAKLRPSLFENIAHKRSSY